MNSYECDIQKARAYPAQRSLEEFLHLSREQLKADAANQWLVGACPEAETRLLHVLTSTVQNPDGQFIEPVTRLPVAILRDVNILNLDAWTPNASTEIHSVVMVKNPENNPNVQGLVGEHNAVLIFANVAYLAKVTEANNVAYIVRPIISFWQSDIIHRLQEAERKIKMSGDCQKK